MFGSTVVHHRNPLSPRTDCLRVVIPVRYAGYIQLLLGVWFGAWAVMEAILAANFINVLRKAADSRTLSPSVLGTMLAFFTAAGAFIAWRLLWVSKGREILDVTPSHLALHRLPGGETLEEYERARIRNLHVGSYSGKTIYPSWGRRFIGKEEAFLEFEYEGNTHHFARGISRRDAEYLLGMLRN
ncbi:MAG TPA: hypothetical protein VE981_07705 [Planctomycetota bacterium]|nr:hypothetical protein [Planctomycetota bacterium]